ncbi:MAG TPA: hypothetical protein VE046_14630 [Steroidobacteraceae bacterium]|nr:hypothetical protein [Steroidobacteraceae bacterium]
MLKQIVTGLLILGIAAPVFAGDRTPNLNGREFHQRQRIQQGVRSGELTRPETRRLARGEVRLHRNERIAKSDGTVTAAERARLQSEANRMSDRIYRQKHDPQARQ